MGKRGNEHGQVRKEDLDAELAKSSEAPKGPFDKASDGVLKRRRMVRVAKKFGVKEHATPSAAAPGNSTISSVVPKAPAAASGGANPFGGFTFGSSSAPAASSTTKSAFPAFAMPALSTKPVATTDTQKPSTTGSKTGGTTENDQKLIECAQGFLKHMRSLSKVDMFGYQRFITTFRALSKECEATVAKTTTATSTSTNSWDSSRPLFAAKPLISPTAGSATASATKTNSSLFGASAPAAPTGGFSFSLNKPGASAAPVPAFGFSTTPTPAVKAAAEAASATKPESAGDDTNKEEDGEGELEAANDDYEVLHKCQKIKILHVRKNRYIRGGLKLEKHKGSGKNRLVVRDGAVGKVKMNTAIPKGMPLSKSIAPATPKNGPTPIILIKAIFDETTKDNPEDFKIITLQADHDKLFNELQKLV